MSNTIKKFLDFIAELIKILKKLRGGSDDNGDDKPKLDALQQSLINEINAARNNNSLTSLTVDERLVTIAVGHAKFLAANNILTHDGENGSRPADRMRKVTYSWSMAGENIGRNENTPKDMIIDWMSKEGQRRVMLNPNYKEIGVGYSMNNKGHYYWVANFATEIKNASEHNGHSLMEMGNGYDEEN